MRGQVTPAEVQEEFGKQKDTRFGAHILVTDIQISFAQQSGLLAGGRTREQALRMARDVVRRQESGESFDRIAADVNKKQDRSFQAKRIRLYKSGDRGSGAAGKRGMTLDRDAVLYKHAAPLRDGDITSPFETLSEVHVMRREGVRPARTAEEVRSYIVDLIARRKAREWINERIQDEKYVRLQWPLPQRTDK